MELQSLIRTNLFRDIHVAYLLPSVEVSPGVTYAGKMHVNTRQELENWAVHRPRLASGRRGYADYISLNAVQNSRVRWVASRPAK